MTLAHWILRERPQVFKEVLRVDGAKEKKIKRIRRERLRLEKECESQRGGELLKIDFTESGILSELIFP
jgi:hypothetical protein